MNELKDERYQIAEGLRQMAKEPDVIALHPTALRPIQACRGRFGGGFGKGQGIARHWQTIVPA
ncbi:hypothetical protein AAFX91_36425 [Bradyrhizobium sp. 31Argb]|uniref:hypothetical protein n=1 Tax=Bradyrhizobium sp. 31Argb TaxID=3141247 RepID=UPI0037499966